MKKRKDLGVVIGRFQIHDLHDGHVHILNHVNDRHAELLILVGDNSARLNPSDPFPFDVRKDMLLSHYPDAVILPIKDIEASDEEWSKAVDELINNLDSAAEAVLYGSRDSFIPLYSGNFKTELVSELPGVSATEVRKKVSKALINDPAFRLGWLAAIHSQHDEDVRKEK